VGIPRLSVATPSQPCQRPVLSAHLRARNGVNLRTTASKYSQLICAIPVGSHLLFLGEASDNWLKVQTDDPQLSADCQNQKGWVYAENIDMECR